MTGSEETRDELATSDTLHHAVLRAREHAGPYELGRIIGTGGMGVVHRATAPDGSLCAVKTLRPDLVSGRAKARFAREATVRIDHPNVIRVLDAGTDDDGTPWIAFELLEGETLEDRLRRSAMAVDGAIDVIIRASQGVAAAHAAGFVHRDLKPANLFLCADGGVKVLDFGIAGLAAGPKMTATGQLLGTPAYLAPEQARSTAEADARADVWALGAVLYEMLCGEPPFEAESFFATVLSILMEPVPPLASRAPEVPPALADVVSRCLAKDRDARFADASELAAALTRVRSGEVAPVVTAQPTHRVMRRSTGIPHGEERVVVVLLAEGVEDHAALEEVIREHGGEPTTRFGGSGLGLFGGTRWVGDEAMRAVAAALEGRALAERVAVGSGRASAPSSGLSGGAVSMAERGCRADLEGVAVDAVTARSVSSRFTVQRVDDDVLEVVEQRPPSWMAPRAPETDLLLGRETQLTSVRFALETALGERRAMLVAVTGPAGIGKSAMRRGFERLIEEGPEPMRLLSARAQPLFQETPWSYLASMLRRHAALRAAGEGWPRIDPGASHEERCEGVQRLASEAVADPEVARECAEFLGEILGVRMPDSERLRAARAEPRLMSDRIRLAVADWLEGHASQGPLALLLESVDWADATSLEVLEQIVQDLADVPMVVFATSRKHELVQERTPFSGLDTVHLKLSGIPRAAVGSLAAQIAGRELSAPVVEILAERTEGNPLFVQELVLALAEQGRLDEEQLAHRPLPLSIEAAVQSRLDLLSVEERELVKRASLYGRPFSVGDLSGAGIEQADQLLGALRRRDIVTRHLGGRGPRQYHFRSPLVGEVAYRMIERDSRAALHRRIAIHLATSDERDPSEVARHLDLGESPDASWWWATAAITAAERGDSVSVLSSSERSLLLGAPADRIWRLRMARAEALGFLLRRNEQQHELESALEVASSKGENAETRRQLTFWLQRSGRLDEAIAMAEQAVEDADASGDARLSTVARCALAQAARFFGDVDRAHRLLREAEVSAAGGDAVVRAEIAEALGFTEEARGDLAAARAGFARAAEQYRLAGNVREAAANEQNLADTDNRIGAWADAREALQEAIEGCRRVRNRLGEAYALANYGYSCAKLGAADESLQAIASSERLANEMNDARLLAALRVYRAHAQLAGGNLTDLATEAEAASENASREGLASYGAVALALAARAQLRLGNVREAQRLSERALEMRDELGGVEEDEAEIFVTRVHVLEAAGEGEAAQRVRRRGADRVRELAAKIGDEELRQRFLRDVPANRELTTSMES